MSCDVMPLWYTNSVAFWCYFLAQDKGIYPGTHPSPI
jgi:hypothetical protein